MLLIFTLLYHWILFVVWYFSIAGLVIYASIGLLAKLFPKFLLAQGLFLNRLSSPKWLAKLHQPDQVYGLRGASNHRVISSSGNTLGVWHIPPSSNCDQKLCDATNVVVYCHGNAHDRGFKYRLSLYCELRKAGYHVVTFDYSGFGDSTGHPSVNTLVEDAFSIYNWTTEKIRREDATVVLWGHSLGTHISTRTLCEKPHRLPDALVLEAPFTNEQEAAESFPLSRIFFWLYSYLKEDLRKVVQKHDMQCPTDELLPRIGVPVLIMHARDDDKINFQLGVKLYEKTIQNPETKSRFIRFIHVHERHCVQHYTARAPGLQTIFLNFVNDAIKFKGQGGGSLPDGILPRSRVNKPSINASKTEPVFEVCDI